MFFIILLALSATAIAGSAAFFSVYGLAHIFSGTFWSVVVMGSSLEAGKLVAASYLYRFWKKTGWILKSYLMLGIFALMVLTSTGIFGYLSAGYMSDTAPLAQIDKQVELLNNEKQRLVERKQQIDTQIANLPANYIKGRTQLIKQFKDEQKTVTERISELDKQTLELSQKQLQTQAHVGPIIYIAKAFDLQTDDATKYLIYIIIFAFDPMAVALTLAVNIAIRIRKEEREAEKLLAKVEQPIPDPFDIKPVLQPTPHVVQPQVIDLPKVEPIPDPVIEKEVLQPEIQIPVVEEQPVVEASKHQKKFLLNNSGVGLDPNIQKLMALYRELTQKPSLTREEQDDLTLVEEVLSNHGLLVYLDD